MVSMLLDHRTVSMGVSWWRLQYSPRLCSFSRRQLVSSPRPSICSVSLFLPFATTILPTKPPVVQWTSKWCLDGQSSGIFSGRKGWYIWKPVHGRLPGMLWYYRSRQCGGDLDGKQIYSAPWEICRRTYLMKFQDGVLSSWRKWGEECRT